MKGPSSVIVIAVFVGVCVGQTPREQCANKVLNWLTTFGTKEQVLKILDRGAAGVAKQRSASDIGNDMVLYALSSVATPIQTMKGMPIAMGLINDLGGPAKANETMNRIIPPVEALVSPLYSQLKQQIKTMRANGKTDAQIIAQIYYFGNNKATLAFVQKLARTAKNAATAKELAAVKNRLKGIIFFGKLG
ncbi:hypothetical protein AAVH_20932, partial [Aphelenchoides avenae]